MTEGNTLNKGLAKTMHHHRLEAIREVSALPRSCRMRCHGVSTIPAYAISHPSPSSAPLNSHAALVTTAPHLPAARSSHVGETEKEGSAGYAGALVAVPNMQRNSPTVVRCGSLLLLLSQARERELAHVSGPGTGKCIEEGSGNGASDLAPAAASTHSSSEVGLISQAVASLMRRNRACASASSSPTLLLSTALCRLQWRALAQ
eukprot:259721-Chlamydomonas_euryale.AAC.1